MSTLNEKTDKKEMRHLAYAFVPGAPRAALKIYRLFLTLFLTLNAIAPTNASMTWTGDTVEFQESWYDITSSSDGTVCVCPRRPTR